MSDTLRDFVLNAVEINRIRYADLRRLQRDILPFRITTQQEAEMLLSLDATVERADRDWREYLVPAVAQFAVWGLEPSGRVDQAKADWLLEAVALAPPKTGSAIIRHVVIEAPLIDETVTLRPRPSRETRPATVELAGAPQSLSVEPRRAVAFAQAAGRGGLAHA